MLTSGGKNSMRGAILGVLLLVLLGLGAAAFAYWYTNCPCERMPGARLSGELVEQPVRDWSFANDVELCQIQVDTGLLSHALNLNCMATPEGELYLSCSQCEGKYWSRNAVEHGTGRVRLDDRLYPVTFTKIDDPAEIARAWNARSRKLQGPNAAPTPPQEGWWTFRLESRTEES